MKEILKIAGAFVGVLVGAGFASGQEIQVFFVNFGLWGLAGTLLSAAVFVFLGMALAGMGSRLQATSHKELVYAICGPALGWLVDGMITFFMFAVTVVMLAGAGALMEQQFGLSALLGSALVTVFIITVVCLDIRRVITLIGSVTPVLVMVSLAIAAYAVLTREADLNALEAVAETQTPGARYWWLGALLYVSYNIVAGVPILAIMGGAVANERKAAWGGLLGGAILGGLMLVIAMALLSRLDSIAGAPMPMLLLVQEVSPALSVLVAMVILGMILNTAVGALYAFTARFLPAGTRQFRFGAIGIGLAAYGGSLVGFVSLVGQVYPFFGYLGFFLMAAILFAWIRQRRAGAAPAVAIEQRGN
ncbi:YkvI family membrane protein [Marinobacterium marinum]|uniref:Membrane protein YkvI n=1 Tax=Marinobacterium marinum TaxID=2756129 RepID=A0A7W1X036_9GAMM|nr:hypothetical protein [Marinobacterium marinum]MBA4503273.1 hypothetical protein [Marinobacterium marinum]